MFTRLAKPIVVFIVLVLPMAAGSCKDSDLSAPQNVIPPGPTVDDDFITQSIDGGPESTFIEASGLPNIDCDPRVDWGAYQVVLWHTFTGVGAVNGYDHFFEIMFPVADSVGTYTVQGDFLQALFFEGKFFTAGPQVPTSHGTVVVTRSDSRIEGTYALTVIDSAGTDSLRLSGEFGVDNGFSLSCP
jgi:hypothetical protein